ncbi:unnamed protein product [Closterium sp. NIES-54]
MKELETRWGPAPSGVSKVDPLPSTAPVQVAVVSGAAPGAASVGAVSGGAASEGAEPGGAGSKGDGSGGAEPKGVEPRGAESEGAEFGSAAGASPRMSSPRMSSQQLREWLVQRAHSRSGAPRAGGPGDTGSGGAAVTAGAGDPTEPGAAGAGGAGAGVAGVGGPGAGGAGAAGAGVGGTSAGGAGAAGAGAVDPRAGGAGGTVRSRPYFVPLLQQVLGVPSSTGLPPPFLCPPLDQSQPPLQLASPLHVPSHYTKQFGGLTERREPASHPVSPVRTAHRAPRLRPPPVPGTHTMALRPSSVPLCVPLPAPLEFSLPEVPDPESDRAHAASPTVARLLATTVTDPSFESAAASALVAELLGFSAACRLDYVSALVVESVPTSPPSIGGECALGTDVLEDRQEDFECLAAAVPRFASMLLAPEKDPDAPDIPTPRSYAEAIMGPYSSHWQAAMDAEMACWKSTGTYIDAVLPSEANIVDGMWILRGVDYFQTFFPTPKMTTLRLLLHVAARRDYELHSLDFSTASLQGSLHEEIWLRRPPGFTGTFPTGTQWSLRQPVYGLRQTPCEWHDTLRITLAALGFVPSTADPSLFLRTDTLLPPFYVLVYVDDLVFATADTEALTLVLQRFGFQFSSPQLTPLSTSHSLSAPPSDESVEPSGPYPELVGCLMYLMTCTRPDLAYPLSLVACYVAPSRHRKVHWDAAKRVLRYLCSTLGMGLVLGGRGPIVLTGHADASRVHDSATQRSSQGYTFSLSSDSVSWWSTRSSSVLSSSCEAEIYAGTMAAQKLSWLTYLLTDLGEQPRSPPVLYVDNKAMIALCQEHRLEHRTKHIALRYFLARELQQRGQLRLAYVATRANTADVFTKALPPVCGDVVIHPELCFFVNGLHRVRPRVIASGHVLPRAGACGRVRARAGGMEALKQKGNEAFKKGQFSAAALAYRRALEAAAESGEAPRETASLHSNLSCSLLKLGHREEALEAAQQCTELREEWNKGWFRKGEALFALQRYDEAEEAYRQALDRAPDDATVKQCLLLALEAQQGFLLRQLFAGREFCVGRGRNVIESQIFRSAQQMRNFIYLVGDAHSREAIVVDGAWDVEGILRYAEAERVKLVGAVVTHYHFDHTGGMPPPPFDALGIKVPGIKELAATHGLKVCCLSSATASGRCIRWCERCCSASIVNALSSTGLAATQSSFKIPCQRMLGFGDACLVMAQKVYANKHDAALLRSKNGVPSDSIVEVQDGATIEVGAVSLRFIHTPGHTPGSQCIHIERAPGHDDGVLISGDTLFIGSCGRLDLPDCNREAMYDSLQKLAALPPDTRVYPGHDYGGAFTSIGKEKATGFLRPMSKQQWLASQAK